jgi:3-dehydroquinate synthase
MIGTFNLPKFVICELEMLKTLPQSELLSGMAEVVKHGAIADLALFEYIEQNVQKVLDYDAVALERFVYDSVVIKSTIVNQDAKETGARRLFNFGHTFGHAIEKNTKIQHGMAVSVGMVIAAKISVARGLLSQAEADRLAALLQALGLPTDFIVEPQALLEALKRDKKREGDGIHFVLLTSIGTASVEKLTLTELETIINDLH